MNSPRVAVHATFMALSYFYHTTHDGILLTEGRGVKLTYPSDMDSRKELLGVISGSVSFRTSAGDGGDSTPGMKWKMDCPYCQSSATTERPECTELSNHRFCWGACKKRFNERTGALSGSVAKFTDYRNDRARKIP